MTDAAKLRLSFDQALANAERARPKMRLVGFLVELVGRGKGPGYWSLTAYFQPRDADPPWSGPLWMVPPEVGQCFPPDGLVGVKLAGDDSGDASAEGTVGLQWAREISASLGLPEPTVFAGADA
ncbi:MAG TPA: hypothetical protein VEJ63_10405 [Planctomycetota bacterium]|nr:hypothetical protein [Planctomycetota bacterium]